VFRPGFEIEYHVVFFPREGWCVIVCRCVLSGYLTGIETLDENKKGDVASFDWSTRM
jgi:hypothetical protein